MYSDEKYVMCKCNKQSWVVLLNFIVLLKREREKAEGDGEKICIDFKHNKVKAICTLRSLQKRLLHVISMLLQRILHN